MRNFIVDRLTALPAVQKAAAYRKEKRACVVTGLTASSKPVFFAALDKVLGGRGSLAFICATREEVQSYRRAAAYLYPDLPAQELYPFSLPRPAVTAEGLEVAAARSAALSILAGEVRGIAFITAEAFLQKQPHPLSKERARLSLKVGDSIDRQAVIEWLAASGYERCPQVDGLGQFALRGGIMDVYPINSSVPLRIEWFDKEIDSLRDFSIENQRSSKELQTAAIAPIAFAEDGEETAPLFAHCHPDTLTVMDEPARVFELAEKVLAENSEHRLELFDVEELEEQCKNNGVLLASVLGHSHQSDLPVIKANAAQAAPYNKNTALLMDDLRSFLKEGLSPVIMLDTSIKARSFAESLKGQGLPALYGENGYVSGSVNLIFGEIDHGFRFAQTDWLLLTEKDIFGSQKRRRLPRKGQGAQLQYFSDIKAGDYVVHRTHGIGRYEGVETLEVGGSRRDFLRLVYAGGDRLYVATDQVGQLHRYVGGEDAPKLSRMGGADWRRATKKAAQAVSVLAEELVRLYAQRQVQPGHAFEADTPQQKEFEEAFPFEETPDQLQAIAEIKADMEQPRPMDRLLCGDAGYGKTEVAARAAFKCIMGGKQVALLVPTTVLGQQHYLTLEERMQPFGVNIALLNRFCSAQEERRILEETARGSVDLLIGTHRLLQPDVSFKDLGLLIIDEEQRFGVAQKEKLKRWRSDIDVLTLSATPIPRTLHMAMVKTRDMSVIESPPEDRLPVQTYVAEYDDALVREAIRRELRRGGRIFYVYNRISGLAGLAARLQRLVPEVRIKVGHGRMTEESLEDVMLSFYEGDCDLLLSTTIVENGLDVPLANTIIVEGADRYGLSQLYQLRGRVGRSSRLAYAYFLYQPHKALSEVAEKRLSAIRDFTELGAGFKIAMRDLEVRGAGNILGAQQHGHIASVGFATYCQLLEEAIARLQQGQTKKIEPEPILEISGDAYIPDDYIAEPRFKMEVYRRFAEMQWQDRDDFLDELIDRFGAPPPEVERLWRLACLRALCRLLKVRDISVGKNQIRLVFAPGAPVAPEVVAELLKINRGRLAYKAGPPPQLTYRAESDETDPLKWSEDIMIKLLSKERR